MNKTLKKTIQVLFSFGITFLLVYYVLNQLDLDELWRELSKTNFTWVAAVGLFTFFGYYIRAARWQLMLAPTNNQLTGPKVFWAMMSGYFMNLVIPRMGEVSRCIYLKKTDNVDIDRSIGTVINERIADLIVLLSIILITVLVEPEIVLAPIKMVFHENSETNSKVYLTAAGAIIILLTFGFILRRKRKSENTIIKKIIAFFSGIKEGILSISEMPYRNHFLAETIFIWVSYFFMFYFCFLSLDNTSHLGFKEAFIIMAMSGIGMVLPLPAALGAFFFVIKSLEYYGLSDTISASYTSILFTVQILFVIATGGISLLLFSLTNKAQKNENEG